MVDSTLRKATESAIKVLENKRLRMDEHLIPIVLDDLRQALATLEQEPVWCGCGDGIVANDEAMCGVCVMRLKDQIERMKTQPEQDHGFDRTASHMAGEYVDAIDTSSTCVDENEKCEQEPVAWLDEELGLAYTVEELADGDGTCFIPLFTVPPSKPWQSLTDEAIIDEYCKQADGTEWAIGGLKDAMPFARAIEAALKERNK